MKRHLDESRSRQAFQEFYLNIECALINKLSSVNPEQCQVHAGG